MRKLLRLVKVTEELADIEFAIANSDPFYNRIWKDREELTLEDIDLDHRESAEMGAERYLVADGASYVGILDFLMVNPNDNCTWLGLLQVDKKRQGQGYGGRLLELFIQVMKDRKVESFRIGVIEGNKPAFRFWTKQGFDYVKTVVNGDKKKVWVYEKKIG